ncbi:hypothetical protein DUNSADRAFT_8871 [Dunaliella salina]|uniref:Uncharacterized protein n=1 Tax=Dunaliella salina TaxID=3046 RepID=A0ABQ7H5P9_DUNSA|nr:hypothetical protein DUNSADRAFT_8871 [Dunaliella salina]|eukprot:KAF5842184.1 hypothetical protein DUNSADRAFT_8871 [Dunaliella salina]
MSTQVPAQAHWQQTDRSSIRRRQEILENIRKQKAKEGKPAPQQTSFAEEHAVVAQAGDNSDGHVDAVEQNNLDALEEELQQELMGMGPASVGDIDSNLDSKDLDAAMRAVEQSTGISTGSDQKPPAHGEQ